MASFGSDGVRCAGQRVWKSRLGLAVGVGICWDQWFPECARAMALQGADVLLYPSAIGTEPQVRLPQDQVRLQAHPPHSLACVDF